MAQPAALSKRAVKQVLRLYVGQYKKYWPTFTLAFSLPALGSVLSFYVPPIFVGQIVDEFVNTGDSLTSSIMTKVFWFGAVWILGEGLWRIGLHHAIRGQAQSMSDLSDYAFKQLMHRDYNFYSNNFVGSLTKKTLALARSFEDFSDTIMFNVVTFLGPLIFTYFVLGRYSLWLPIAITLWVALGVALITPLIRRRAKLVTARHNAQSKASGFLSDSILNVLAIKAFAREKTENKDYLVLVNDFTKKMRKAWDYHNQKIDTLVAPTFVLANVSGLLIILWMASRIALSPGAIVVVFAYFTALSQIFWNLNRIYRNIESALSEAGEFTELMLEDPEIMDAPDAKPLVVKNASIQLENVTFHYDEVESHAEAFMHDLNLTILDGQRLGLVGPSGGGKTTITKLLLRFKDVLSGTISIDGIDIREVTQSSLRDTIAYVPQEPLLFHRSIADNIRYGRPEATDEEVIQAAILANADEFVSQLPEGYETTVGERGIKLSGGQKQRVAIARAMLKDAPIIVLDEATSALDSASEQLIQDALWKLMEGRTAIVIAHRLSTVQKMDRIVVLQDGSVVEDGTHAQLVAKQHGVYAKLWAHQSGGFID
jgi:ATP-binding cassette subfamily B protein